MSASSRSSSPGEQALDLDRPVDEDLVLTTVDGVEDFLLDDLGKLDAVSAVSRRPAAVRCHLTGPLGPLYRNRLWSTAAIPLTSDPGDPGFLEPLRRSADTGVLAAYRAPDWPTRFRVASSHYRGELIDRVTTELGWVNDPGRWDVNLTEHDRGWGAEVGSLYWTRRFGALERRPWSTTPLVAEAMVRLLKPEPGMSVLDPCCGTGTLLIAVDGNVPGCRLSGTDVDATSIEMARRNLQAAAVPTELADLAVRPATPIAAPAGGLDRVVANLPFGKLVGSHETNATLYPALLNAIASALTRSGRAVLLTEDKTLLVDAVARAKGVKIVKQRVLRYRGATPTAYVVTRTRR